MSISENLTKTIVKEAARLQDRAIEVAHIYHVTLTGESLPDRYRAAVSFTIFGEIEVLLMTHERRRIASYTIDAVMIDLPDRLVRGLASTAAKEKANNS